MNAMMIKLSRGYLSSSPLDINSQELTELTKSPNYNDYRSSAQLSKRQSMHLTLKGSYNEVSLKRVELFVARRSLAKKIIFSLCSVVAAIVSKHRNKENGANLEI